MENDFSQCRFCLVCGFDFEPDIETWLDNICPCCGAQLGLTYSIDDGAGALRYRTYWVEHGCRWSDEKEKPDNWSFEEQKKNIPKELL